MPLKKYWLVCLSLQQCSKHVQEVQERSFTLYFPAPGIGLVLLSELLVLKIMEALKHIDIPAVSFLRVGSMLWTQGKLSLMISGWHVCFDVGLAWRAYRCCMVTSALKFEQFSVIPSLAYISLSNEITLLYNVTLFSFCPKQICKLSLVVCDRQKLYYRTSSQSAPPDILWWCEQTNILNVIVM